MAKQIQLRRGTTVENNAFTGANGELTYDTEKKQLRVHDGSTVGGKVVDDPTRNVTSQVSNATETIAGKAKIATTAIAQAGTNDTDIITAKKLRNALNASDGAPISACRAWVVFNASSSGVTILNSLNVSSVLRTAIGKYIINFATPMPTANYALMGFCPRNATNSTNSAALDASVTPTTTSVSVMVNQSSGGIDLNRVSFGVFC